MFLRHPDATTQLRLPVLYRYVRALTRVQRALAYGREERRSVRFSCCAAGNRELRQIASSSESEWRKLLMCPQVTVNLSESVAAAGDACGEHDGKAGGDDDSDSVDGRVIEAKKGADEEVRSEAARQPGHYSVFRLKCAESNCQHCGWEQRFGTGRKCEQVGALGICGGRLERVPSDGKTRCILENDPRVC